jgi:acetyl-CoA decarbonylase/synthase complex subunit epsilon
MNRAEPWQKAEIGGTEKALAITKPEVVAAMLKRAKHPIMIIGHEAAETEIRNNRAVDLLIQLAIASKVPVVATAHAVKEFVSRGFQPASWTPIMDIANRLRDPEWKGLDGKGPYDLALFAGFQYYLEWLVLSGLRNSAPELKTISLDRFYQPHASWSFPNISLEDWKKNIDVINSKLKTG